LCICSFVYVCVFIHTIFELPPRPCGPSPPLCTRICVAVNYMISIATPYHPASSHSTHIHTHHTHTHTHTRTLSTTPPTPQPPATAHPHSHTSPTFTHTHTHAGSPQHPLPPSHQPQHTQHALHELRSEPSFSGVATGVPPLAGANSHRLRGTRCQHSTD
jgi:hypothetical protein